MFSHPLPLSLHPEANRTARLFAMYFAFATLFSPSSAISQDAASDMAMGERLVEARCIHCHGERALAEFVEKCTLENGEDYLEEFLRSHHAPDDEARWKIIAFLTCEDAE